MTKKRAKKKGGRGKRKGNAFERKIAGQLSEWWTNGERDDVFWKSDNSGGRASARDKKGKTTANSYGDLCVLDPIGNRLMQAFTFELKTGYPKISIFDLIETVQRGKSPSELEKWIEGAQADADGAGSVSWALIVQRTGRKAILMIPGWVYMYLRTWAPGIRKIRPMCSIIAKLRTADKRTRDMNLQCCILEDFLEQVSKKSIISFLNDWNDPTYYKRRRARESKTK